MVSSNAHGDDATTHLVSEARLGSPAASGKLIQRIDPYLKRQVRRHLGTSRFRSDGEDLLQILRLAVFEGLSGVRATSGRRFRCWLKRVVHNRIQNWEKGQRAKRRCPTRPLIRFGTGGGDCVPAKEETPTHQARMREEIELLRRSIERVPARYRRVLRLVLERAPSPEELEAFLHKDPEEARKFVERALKHLKRVLEARGGRGDKAGPPAQSP